MAITNYAKLKKFSVLAKNGCRWTSFLYTKENGEVSRRNILLNIDIAKAMAKRNNPIKGVGNWVSNCETFDRNGFVVKKGNQFYVRGMARGEKVAKMFKIENISDIK